MVPPVQHPVQNFTVDSVDSEGRHLIYSNHILDIISYDTTGETWRRDYTGLNNPFVNPTFSAPTVTGTGPSASVLPGSGWYETGTDATVPPSPLKYFKIGKLPFDYTNELLATYGTLLTSTPVSNGTPGMVTGDFFIDATSTTIPKNVFPTKYTIPGWHVTDDFWATTSGITGGPRGVIAWTLNPPQEVAGFYIDSFDADETTTANAVSSCIGNYQIQIGNTGTGLVDSDYTTIASGTVPAGWTHPLWIDIPPTTAKYVRLRFRNNGGTRSGLVKMFAYSKQVIDAGMSAVVTKVLGGTSAVGVTKTFQLEQSVDFTGLDRVYFDVKDYTANASTQLHVIVNGVNKIDFQTPNVLSTIGDSYTYVRGLSVDVSSNGAGTIFRFSKTMLNQLNNDNTHSEFLCVSNFSQQPTWFRESSSSKRSSRKDFPQKSVIVTDTKGFSILDVTDLELGPKLWMRFDFGFRKMLQQIPRKLVVKDGVIYLATTRGLYVVDFSRDWCARFNEKGVWVRHGIDTRNENGFDFSEWIVNSIPARILLNYTRLFDTPALPSLCINDLAVGQDSTFGKFVVLGTNTGLVVFNNKFDATAAFFSSSDTRPVTKVVISNGSIWYAQGEGDDQAVKYLSSVNSAAANGFVAQKVYYKPITYLDSLASLDRYFWEVMTEDPAMTLEHGTVLTISGSHTKSGTAGLISKQVFRDRSFTAKVKVKLLDFPPDARGAVRFGICRDYKHLGLMSLDSDVSGDVSVGVRNARSGFFISAFNIDSYGWPSFGSTPFTSEQFDDRWFFLARDVTNNISTGVSRVKTATPTISGIALKAYQSAGITVAGSTRLFRVTSVQPVLARDFTVRVNIQQEQGFNTPVGTAQSSNPNLWFGISSHQAMVPGALGTSTSFVDAAMMVTGSTTFSGVSIYTVGKYDTSGEIFSSALTQPRIPVAAGENTGHTTSPYREWRLDYDHGANRLTTYIDNTLVDTIVSTAALNPNRIGLTFGVGQHGAPPAPQTIINRTAFFRDLRVDYPALVSGSRYKYGVEVSNADGRVESVFRSYTTYSGISRSGDTVPASGTLTSLTGLSDGNLTTGAISAAQNLSVGIGLSGARTVESLYLYDASSATSGWNNTATKRVEVWHSPDNVFWSKYKEYDLNYQERALGLTKLRFAPAIEDKFFKVRCLDAAYAVPGGAPWSISELRAMTVSGTDFFPEDGTPAADFHEWRLDYNSSTKEIRGYIDGTLVSKSSLPAGLNTARFVLAHDLSVVSSGIDSTFHGEFKDFEVTFSGSGVTHDEISSMFVNHTTLSGGNHNYTLLTGSTSDVTVSDYDLGTNPVADLVRVFDHDAIFGAAKKITTFVPETAAGRHTGVVFVGTNNFSYSRYVLAGKRPYWYNSQANTTYILAADECLRYGDDYTFVYHPARDVLFILHSTNATYYVVSDLSKRTWRQLPRSFYLEAFGYTLQAPGDFQLQYGQAKGVYAPFDDKVWLLSAFGHFYGIDVDTGKVFPAIMPDTNAFENITYGGINSQFNARWYITYVLHRHRLLLGQDFIGLYDFATNSFIAHPRNFANGNYRLVTPPWSEDTGQSFDAFASASAAYADYDRCVYFLVKSYDQSTVLAGLYRYHVDKVFLEFLTEASEVVVWPTSDAVLDSQTQAYIGARKSSTLVYDSRRKRMYAVSQRGVRVRLAYWDLIENKWVNTGEEPPVTSLRRWPGGDPGGGFNTTNFAQYNSNHGSIYIMVGRGDVQGSYVYEYFPDEIQDQDVFDYTPVTDGLPTASGVAKQYTTRHDVFLVPNYTNSTDFARDFYTTATQTALRFTKTFGPDFLTISGSVVGGSAVTDLYELNVTSEEIGSTRSFEVSGKIAFPAFSRRYTMTTGKPPHCYFRLGFSDGVNRDWVTPTTVWGRADLNLYQEVDIRVGVSGTLGAAVTDFPLRAHIAYVDGFNTNNDAVNDTLPVVAYDTYLSGGIDLGSAPVGFRDYRLSYTYETDTVEGFLDGVSIGTTKLRRKFNPSVRFQLGMSAVFREDSNGSAARWVAQVKDLKVNLKASDRIEGVRLLTSVSGSIGTYTHERFDSTIVSGTHWVYEFDGYLPKHFRYPGYDYIATLGGIGDGRKLAELAAFIGPGGQHMVGFTGDPNKRHDFNSYVGFAANRWDDSENSYYVVKKDAVAGTVGVYLNHATEPAFVVDYEDLPATKNQSVYYGKNNYGSWEHTYDSPTLVSGTWVSNPDYTGVGDPLVGKLAFNSTASFATRTQGTGARAEYTLDSGLGEVDLYCFYHATGFDAVKNAPYTVVSSGIINVPTPIGEGNVIFGVATNTDELGNFAENKTTVRVDQRRTNDGKGTSTNKLFAQASGWVFIGRYRNPTLVIQTASAQVGTTSTQGFVCVDAIAVDIGKYGKSTFDMAVKRIRYRVGSTELPVDSLEESGLTVIDLSTDTVLDAYGEDTAPGLLDGDITTGTKIE